MGTAGQYRDLHNPIKVSRLISPVSEAGTTPLVSQIIDTLGFEGLELLFSSGSIADADATFVLLIEHGNDSGLSDAAAVPDTMLLGTEVLAQFGFANDDEIRKIGYRGDKRYVRATITPAANASAALFSGVAIQSGGNTPVDDLGQVGVTA